MTSFPVPPANRLLLASLLLLAVLAAALAMDVRALLAWIESTGPWAPLVFVLLYIGACVLLVPATFPTMAAGVLFDLPVGVALVSVASTTAAGLSFALGRTLLRDQVERWLASRPRLRALDAAVAREGTRVVALARLSPLVPFSAVNYAFGVTRIGFWRHLLVTLVSTLPGTTLYVWLGSATARVTDLRAQATPTRAGEALFWGGLLATLVLTTLLTRMATRALSEVIDEDA